ERVLLENDAVFLRVLVDSVQRRPVEATRGVRLDRTPFSSVFGRNLVPIGRKRAAVRIDAGVPTRRDVAHEFGQWLEAARGARAGRAGAIGARACGARTCDRCGAGGTRAAGPSIAEAASTRGRSTTRRTLGSAGRRGSASRRGSTRRSTRPTIGGRAAGRGRADARPSRAHTAGRTVRRLIGAARAG